MEATARVIPWTQRTSKENPVSVSQMPEPSTVPAHEFASLEGVLLALPDEQLDALGTIFASSPLRKAMTFEGYLVVKGFGRPFD
jgi:hypothetical protein